MPTVVLLDVSLSMLRRVKTPDEELVERKQLAIRGLHAFFDFLSSKFKLEFSALLAFSSLWEIVVPFTRDYQSLKQGCITVDTYDKTSFDNGFSGVVGHVIEEWGTSVPCQVILVTDGRTGSGQGSLRDLLDGKRANKGNPDHDQPSPFPIPFPCKIHVVCIANSNELGADLMLFQRLCDSTGVGGSVYVPDMPLTFQSVQNAFMRLAQTHYVSYEGTLSCGHLQSKITLSPPPDFTTVLETSRKTSGQEKNRRLPNELSICGFLDVADIGSPPHLSRHLVIPIPTAVADGKEKEGGKDTTKDGEEDGKIPCFCVLLHGSLKVEKMVAIVSLDSDWFGMLHSWADSKKKSNLVLTTFKPGENIPWLGNIQKLGPAAELDINPYQSADNDEAETSPFPVMPSQRRSYNSQANVVWIKPSGLQSDVQKLLRYAKRLPEKQGQFYKELNRLRRAALCYSYVGLLDVLASMLDKECNKANAKVTRQLKHASESLRAVTSMDLNKPITPLVD
ncbi:integrator complex subunit 14-like [Montipora capricornis]|uniref:integrator complex subunit 14-like n=1 Tax=Montipora capricornis TaxID=246305 RepID=UPI0035F10EF4